MTSVSSFILHKKVKYQFIMLNLNDYFKMEEIIYELYNKNT